MQLNDFLKQDLFLERMNDEKFKQAMKFLINRKCRVKNISLHINSSSNSQINNLKNFIEKNESVTKIDLNFYNQQNHSFLKRIFNGALVTLPLYLCNKMMNRINEDKSTSYLFAYAAVTMAMISTSITAALKLYQDINHQSELEKEIEELINKNTYVQFYNGSQLTNWQERTRDQSVNRDQNLAI